MHTYQRLGLALALSGSLVFAVDTAWGVGTEGAAKTSVAPYATGGPFVEPVEVADLESLAKDREAKASRHKVGRRISRYMSAAAEEVDEGNPEEAKALLQRLDPKRLNPYQRGLVYRFLGFIAYGNQDTEQAIQWFQKTLDEEVLPLRDESKLRFSIAQLHAGREEWDQTLTAIDEWRRFEATPDPLGFYLRAIALYQQEDYDGAIANTKEALARSEDPREGWLKLLSALYLSQKQDYDNAALVLEELLLRYPKKQYWVQLALIYGAREDYEVSLAVQQMAHSQGFLTEDKELTRLARSYLYRDLPYPAAKVLAAGLDSGQIEGTSEAYELLANSWIQAREFDRSLAPLKRAAELSEGGDLHVRLGQVHMQREQWTEAAKMLETAIEKGDLTRESNAILLLGIAFYNDSQPNQARRYFRRAASFDDTRAQAENWIAHINRETAGESSEPAES